MKATQETPLPSVRRAYCEGRYGQVHYRLAMPMNPGHITQPPLLCLHQTPKSGMDYEPIMPLLARDRIVLAPDTPGYGGSDAPPEPIGIPDFAIFAREFLDTMLGEIGLAAHRVDLMGYHTGCITAAELANTCPNLVRKVVMVSLAAYDAEQRQARLDAIDRFPVPKPDASHVGALWRLMESMHDTRVGLDWKHASLAEHLRSGERLPWGFMAVYRYDFLAALDRLEQPVLLFCPGDDLWEPTQRHYARIRNVTLAERAQAAHGFLLVDAPQVAADIRSFLDGKDA